MSEFQFSNVRSFRFVKMKDIFDMYKF